MNDKVTFEDIYYKVLYYLKENLPDIAVILATVNKLPAKPDQNTLFTISSEAIYFSEDIALKMIADGKYLELEQLTVAACIASVHQLPVRGIGLDADVWNQSANTRLYSLMYNNGFPLPKRVLAALEFDQAGQAVFGSDEYSYESLYGALLEEGDKQQSPQTGDGEGSDQEDQSSQATKDITIDSSESVEGSAGSTPPMADVNSGDAKNKGRYRGANMDVIDRGVEPLKNNAIPYEKLIKRAYEVGKYGRTVVNPNRFNRRLLGQGVLIPAKKRQSLGEVVIYIDTSASVTDAELDYMTGSHKGLAAKCKKLTIKYFDTKLRDKPTQRGGTSYKCLPLDRVITYIIVTDGDCNSFPKAFNTKAKIHWAVYTSLNFKPPFGKVQRVKFSNV